MFSELMCLLTGRPLSLQQGKAPVSDCELESNSGVGGTGVEQGPLLLTGCSGSGGHPGASPLCNRDVPTTPSVQLAAGDSPGPLSQRGVTAQCPCSVLQCPAVSLQCCPACVSLDPEWAAILLQNPAPAPGWTLLVRTGHSQVCSESLLRAGLCSVPACPACSCLPTAQREQSWAWGELCWPTQSPVCRQAQGSGSAC